MKFRCLLLLALCLAARVPAAPETLRPDQLKPGMKGYGLSVFRGTTPERFDVEIIGVLQNAFPKQDMILIRSSGAGLEKHKTIAGMSGSPIYIDGKLIGALAYGWSFENDPLAGVTPIHNMLSELDRKPQPAKQLATALTFFEGFAPPAAAGGENYAALRPLLTPLAMGGFSPRTVGLFAGELKKLGLLPVAGGGTATGKANQPKLPVEPGGSLGVTLIRGDFDATGVGTVSYVDGHKVLAFGHPMMGSGHLEAPVVIAEVYTIMSSVARSFKLAGAVSEVGSLVGDWQSCIVADTKLRARMIPVTVAVANPDTGHREQFTMEVVDNPALTPRLVPMAIAEAIGVVSGSSDYTTVKYELSAELADRTIRVTDTDFNATGGMLPFGVMGPIRSVMSSPFGRPELKRIDVKVEAALRRDTAEIKRAYFSKAEVERGERVPLHVVLKPYGKPEVTRTIEIDVPAVTDSMRLLSVVVMGGDKAPADVAPPDDLNDYLNAIQKKHRSTDLVAVVQSPGQSLQYKGKLLKNLPPSAVAVLDDSSTTEIRSAVDTEQIVVGTDWVLTGQAAVRVPIRQE